ncbi:MAG: hypothetical protein E6I66_09525 [Chloroflexi bacterium]|nr:MAG: hypothetical protein E6I66_09525 [Chloroflexota bacterium]
MDVKGPYSFEYARIAVPDLEATKGWYEKYVGVDFAGKTDGHTYLRAGLPHHALDLVEDRSLKKHEVRAFGFSVESEEVLGALKKRVKDWVAPVKELDRKRPGAPAASRRRTPRATRSSSSPTTRSGPRCRRSSTRRPISSTRSSARRSSTRR